MFLISSKWQGIKKLGVSNPDKYFIFIIFYILNDLVRILLCIFNLVFQISFISSFGVSTYTHTHIPHPG